MDHGEIRLGVIGCGGFGLFALQQFAQVPGVKLVGMAGTHRPAALAAARGSDSRHRGRRRDPGARRRRPGLHRHPAVPPPPAGDGRPRGRQARDLREAAGDDRRPGRRDDRAGAERDRLLVANLMQRYNPLFDAVGRLVEARVLGEVLHGTFENYASDENLRPEHWFWDRSKSGGIFVEHGVHFFDLFAGWLGPGRVEAAQVGVRPGSRRSRSTSSARSATATALVNFYHGFHQAGRMDRQELRLVFERGDVTLYDWVPTRARVHAIVDEAQTRDLCDLFPGARLDVTATYAPKDRACRGRHKAIDAYQMIELAWGDGVQKSHLYGGLLRAVMADQVAWIRDRSHPGGSPRPTAATRWPSPARPTGWPSLIGTEEPNHDPRTALDPAAAAPADLAASRDDFEVVGVFNPGAVRVGRRGRPAGPGGRAPRERRPGFTGLPRWESRRVDGRLGARRRARRRSIRGSSGARPTGWSGSRSPRTCGSSAAATGGRSRRSPTSRSGPNRRWRSSASRTRGSRRSTAGSTSPTSPSRGTARRRPWRRRPTFGRSSGTGSSSAPRTRTWSSSPAQIGGAYAALHRPNAATPFTRPEMWVAWSPDLIHWGRHGVLHGGGAEWQTGRVGAGPPPVRVADGWLEIYHGNRHPTEPGEVGKYSTGALLLDADDPARVLRRTPESIFEPRPTSSATASCPTSSSRPGSSRPEDIPRLLRRGRHVHGGRRVCQGRGDEKPDGNLRRKDDFSPAARVQQKGFLAQSRIVCTQPVGLAALAPPYEKSRASAL